MMPSPRAMLLLAGSDLPEKELLQFFQWAARSGAREVVERLASLRSFASDPDGVTSNSSRRESNSKKMIEELRIQEHLSMIDSVEQLLLSEARLSKGEATKILLEELRDVPTEYGYLTQPNKISFRSWLARLGEDVSDSRVLHVASKVRNHIVHGSRSKSDWPI